jgi:hypothetical protein
MLYHVYLHTQGRSKNHTIITPNFHEVWTNDADRLG